MLESLGRIKNPFVRSVTAAATVCSVVTLTAAVALGIAKAKDESVYRFSVYSSLIGAGCSAVFGLVYTSKAGEVKSAQNLINSQSVQSTDNGKVWKDWRNFVVVRKVKESEEITSFYLKPEDKGEIPNFQPGQFLTIKLDIPGQNKPVIRTYSLSDYPEPFDYYRLSIKREPVPKGLDVPPGIASNFMHDRIQEVSVIPAKPPNGKFVLDVNKSIPAVLISNGGFVFLSLKPQKLFSRFKAIHILLLEIRIARKHTSVLSGEYQNSLIEHSVPNHSLFIFGI